MTRPKLMRHQVAAIREQWAAGGVEQLQLAAEYDVSATVISQVVRGLVWKSAPGPITAAGFRSGVPHHRRLSAEAGPCSGCGRTMIRERDHREDRQMWRDRGCVKLSGHGRCVSCSDKARRRESRAANLCEKPAQVGDCSGCGRPMVRRRAYEKDPAGWRAQGCVKVGGGQRCAGCAGSARRGGSGRVVVVVRRKRERPQPLSPAEVARLRALVGLPSVLSSERAA
jgi:hypothetical protein